MEKPVVLSYKRFIGSKDSFYSDELASILEFFTYRKEYILLYTKEFTEAGGNTEVIEAARAALLEEQLQQEETSGAALQENGVTESTAATAGQ